MGRAKNQVRQETYAEVAKELEQKRKEYIEVYTSQLDVNEKFDKLGELNVALEVLKKKAVALYNAEKAVANV